LTAHPHSVNIEKNSDNVFEDGRATMTDGARRQRRLTITDIATAAGVSIPTVSKVINGRTDVAAATRERVLGVIDETGYVVGRAARAMRHGRSGLIDLVVPALDSEYLFEIIRGVEEALEPTGLRLVLSVSGHAARRERQWLNTVMDGSTDGAILVLARGQSAQLDELRQQRIPFVVIDHRGELGSHVPSVGATNFAGGRAATDYLLSLGHQRIAMISGPIDLRCSQERISGYRASLQEADIPVDVTLIRHGTFLFDAGDTATRELLALPNPPTAIFAGSDLQAFGVYQALRALGRVAPRDVSVVGFDDVPSAARASPPLTTIRQPLGEMGRVATSMLLRLLSDKPLDTMRVELATTLLPRASCAPPTKGGDTIRR